jgi:hypothetical protein
MPADGIERGKLGFKFRPVFRLGPVRTEPELIAALGPHNGRTVLICERGVFTGLLLRCQCRECLEAQISFTRMTKIDIAPLSRLATSWDLHFHSTLTIINVRVLD